MTDESKQKNGENRTQAGSGRTPEQDVLDQLAEGISDLLGPGMKVERIEVIRAGEEEGQSLGSEEAAQVIAAAIRRRAGASVGSPAEVSSARECLAVLMRGLRDLLDRCEKLSTHAFTLADADERYKACRDLVAHEAQSADEHGLRWFEDTFARQQEYRQVLVDVLKEPYSEDSAAWNGFKRDTIECLQNADGYAVQIFAAMCYLWQSSVMQEAQMSRDEKKQK